MVEEKNEKVAEEVKNEEETAQKNVESKPEVEKNEKK